MDNFPGPLHASLTEPGQLCENHPLARNLVDTARQQGLQLTMCGFCRRGVFLDSRGFDLVLNGIDLRLRVIDDPDLLLDREVLAVRVLQHLHFAIRVVVVRRLDHDVGNQRQIGELCGFKSSLSVNQLHIGRDRDRADDATLSNRFRQRGQIPEILPQSLTDHDILDRRVLD